MADITSLSDEELLSLSGKQEDVSVASPIQSLSDKDLLAMSGSAQPQPASPVEKVADVAGTVAGATVVQPLQEAYRGYLNATASVIGSMETTYAVLSLFRNPIYGNRY